MFEKIIWDLPGSEIEKESFRRIEDESRELKKRFTADEWRVARRLIHTTADFSIADSLQFSNNPFAAALKALKQGVPIYSDSNMIKAGISVMKLQKFNQSYSRDRISCFIADSDVAKIATDKNITRALAALEKGKKIIDGSIFICGNAPLALAGMVKMFLEQQIRPALVIGMPVGFVNVVESKELLQETSIPYITLNGRRGGSPLAVATLHALMEKEL